MSNIIYRNDNLIIKDNYVIGTIKDLKEYFRYEIASQCMTGEEEKENFTNNLRNVADLLDNLEEEDKQIYSTYDLLKVSEHPMGGFIIERECV